MWCSDYQWKLSQWIGPAKYSNQMPVSVFVTPLVVNPTNNEGKPAAWTSTATKATVNCVLQRCHCQYGRVWKVWATDPELSLSPVFSFLYLLFEVNHSLFQILNHLWCLTETHTTFKKSYETINFKTSKTLRLAPFQNLVSCRLDCIFITNILLMQKPLSRQPYKKLCFFIL